MNATAIFIGRWKVRMFRGIAYASIVTSLLVLSNTVRLYEDVLSNIGISLIIAMIGGTLLYVVLCVFGGFVDEKLGTWGAENSHINMNLNPEFREILEWVREQKELKK